MKKLGLVLTALLLLPGCSGTKEILIASYGPRNEETQGLVRIAQDKVLVYISGGKEGDPAQIGEISGATGLIVIPERDFVELVRLAKKGQEQ